MISLAYTWDSIVNESAIRTGIELPRGYLDYLSDTLSLYQEDMELATFRATEALYEANTLPKIEILAERCLLLLGLFPDLPRARNVSDQIYINIGKAAYITISRLDIARVFNKLVTILNNLKPIH